MLRLRRIVSARAWVRGTEGYEELTRRRKMTLLKRTTRKIRADTKKRLGADIFQRGNREHAKKSKGNT